MRTIHHARAALLRVPLEVVVEGVPQTGLTVTARIRRVDGDFYNVAGTSWGGLPTDNPVAELDATDLPGVYSLDLTADEDSIRSEAKAGFIVAFYADDGGGATLVEHVQVTVGDTMTVSNPQLATLPDLENGLIALVMLLLGVEGTTTPETAVHFAETTDAGGTKFYSSHAIPADRRGYMAGRYAVLVTLTTGDQTPVRITSAEPTDGTGEHYVVARLDGTPVPAPGIVAGSTAMIIHGPRGFVDVASAVLEEGVASHSAVAGSLADHLRLMLALRQNNMRTVYTAYNVAGKPTAGIVLVYDSKADAEADTTPYPLATAKYPFEATYDASNRPETYLSVRDDTATP